MKKLIVMCLMVMALGALGMLSACSDARDDAGSFPVLSDQIDDGALPPDTAAPLDDTLVEDDGADEVITQAANIANPRDLSLVTTHSNYLDAARVEVLSSSFDSAQDAFEEAVAEARSERITELTEMITEYVDAYATALDESTGEASDKIAAMNADVDVVRQRAGVALIFAIGYAASDNGEKFDEVIASAQEDAMKLRNFALAAIELAE